MLLEKTGPIVLGYQYTTSDLLFQWRLIYWAILSPLSLFLFTVCSSSQQRYKKLVKSHDLLIKDSKWLIYRKFEIYPYFVCLPVANYLFTYVLVTTDQLLRQIHLLCHDVLHWFSSTSSNMKNLQKIASVNGLSWFLLITSHKDSLMQVNMVSAACCYYC